MQYASRQNTLALTKPVPFRPSVSQFYIPDNKGPDVLTSSLHGTQLPLILPATYFSECALRPLSFSAGISEFLRAQLDVSRLDEIHSHLWMAGKPGPGRPLHQHLVYGRKVVCTEQADMHLLWEETRLFVKPCPDYLLSHDFWERHLCHDEDAWAVALGLLLSYTWLIQHKSDWRLAQAEGIVSPDVTWERWTAFVGSLYHEVDTYGLEPNRRFCYGNLRLTRIQLIYRLCSRRTGAHALINGYFNPYASYRSFFIQNTAPVTAAVVYFALILGAMQVGLSTDRLQGSSTFQSASTFFTILAIIGPSAAVVLLVTVVMSYVFVWNLAHAVRQRRSVGAKPTKGVLEP